MPGVVLGRTVDLSEIFLVRVDPGGRLLGSIASDVASESGCVLDCDIVSKAG